MRTKRIICAILFIVIVNMTVNTAWATKPKPNIAEWTFMVYMAADNNLDVWAYESLSYMEAVELTDEVNVVVLWDDYYEPAYMYRVVSGGHELVIDFPLNGEEVNTGDPTTLKTFVDFATEKFEAQHYLLDLWNHGNDFDGSCYDEHPEDHLTHDEVVTALVGHHIEILAYDACLEAMIEVAYEYNISGMQTDYLVACENYVPLDGYPYDTILDALTKNPKMSALEFAIEIADNYVEFYETKPESGGAFATLSVIDISMVDEAVVELSKLTEALEAKLKENYELYHKIINLARSERKLPWAEYGWEFYIDLPTFVADLEMNLPESDEEIRGLASVVGDALEEVVVHVANSKLMTAASAMGLGIWFPPSEASDGASSGILIY
ncbi:MAG: hypothetical protein JSV05_04020, partial [Candidatus Bathyarchaeota archaeon]